MSIIQELMRRNVIKVALAYGAVAWLLIEITATVFPILKLPEWSIALVTVLLLLGFPLALIFAWAFEITPEGIKLEREVDRSQSITHITGRRIDYIVIATLLLVLAFFIFDKFVLDPSRDAESSRSAEAGNSIAVLPFLDLSPAGDQAYFSDGISEELLNVLARMPGLRVVARTSSFQFKGQNRDIIDIADRLNVALLLEGSVRKQGDQLRIAAQLIDASSGFHLWSGTFDRRLENVFAVQNEISAAVARSVREHLGLDSMAVPRITEASTEAYDAYLRGRYLVVQRVGAAIESAVQEYERALEVDPDYALAHAELAIATLLLRRESYGDLIDSEAVAMALPHVERALLLAPALAEAHAAAGFLSLTEWHFEVALAHFCQALEINPNYWEVHMWMGELYAKLGRYAEGAEMTQLALRLDPLSLPASWNRALQLITSRRLAEAAEVIDRRAALYPGDLGPRNYLTSLDGNWANAALGSLDIMLVEPQAKRTLGTFSWQLAAIGLEQEAQANLERPPWFALSWLGDPVGALALAQARFDEDPESLEALRELGLALAGAGQFADARPILEQLWEQGGARVTDDRGLFKVGHAVALSSILQAAGEKEYAEKVLAAIRDNVRRYREAGIVGAYMLWLSADYEDGLAAYLAGDREKGLALISKAAEDGHFIPPAEAYLQALYEDPGFTSIRSIQEERQLRERNKFLAVVCGDNPYAAIWQPERETCERFRAGRNGI